jgi:hypothetical protein
MAIETNYNDGDARARLAEALYQAFGVADFESELHLVDPEDRNDMAREAFDARDKSVKTVFFDPDTFGSKQQVFATYLEDCDGPCVVRVLWHDEDGTEWSELTHFKAYASDAAADEAVEDVRKALAEYRRENLRLYGPTAGFEAWKEERRRARIEKNRRRYS